MPMLINCECGGEIEVEDDSVGKSVHCPACQREAVVPAQDAGLGVPVASVTPLSYAAPGQSAGGPIAPPPGDELRLPTSIPPKLRFPDCPPCHLVISPVGADVNATFDTSPVLTTFVETFAKKLKKRFDVQLTPPATDDPAMVCFVRVIRIDQGNRFLRYFLGLFAGATVFEIDGRVTAPGRPPVPFTLKHKGRMGLFGGNSLSLLKLSSKVLAKKVAARTKKAAK